MIQLLLCAALTVQAAPMKAPQGPVKIGALPSSPPRSAVVAVPGASAAQPEIKTAEGGLTDIVAAVTASRGEPTAALARGFEASRPGQAAAVVSVPDASAASGLEPSPSRALRDRIWKERVVPSAYSVMPRARSAWASLWGSLKTFLRMGKTFETDGDELPKARGHFKMLHPFGSVLPVTYFAREGQPYTGLFAATAAHGLMRLSLAVAPTSELFIPGAALKLFIDGQSSANAVFLGGGGLDGQQPDHNFFAQPFTNVLPAPKSRGNKIGAWFIGLFNKGNAVNIPVDYFAQYNADGKPAAAPRAPYQLLLKAAPFTSTPSDSKSDFRDDLRKIPLGSLFEVHAVETPGAAPVHIGDIMAMDYPVASEYGDKGLFFRHRRVVKR